MRDEATAAERRALLGRLEHAEREAAAAREAAEAAARTERAIREELDVPSSEAVASRWCRDGVLSGEDVLPGFTLPLRELFPDD